MLKMESLGFVLAFAAAGSCCYASPPEGNTAKQSSLASDRELLEFLAEFEELDDEEFEILVSYAKKDSQLETVESEVEKND